MEKARDNNKQRLKKQRRKGMKKRISSEQTEMKEEE
jgi:hypothetical protein